MTNFKDQLKPANPKKGDKPDAKDIDFRNDVSGRLNRLEHQINVLYECFKLHDGNKFSKPNIIPLLRLYDRYTTTED